jgi:thiamine biosynthesis protein ThiS
MPEIIANGIATNVAPDCRLEDFLAQRGWTPAQVVVELNGRVLPRSQVASVTLRDGDRLEIIVPVAGG